MSAEEAALLAAECPMPSTLNKAQKLAALFRQQCLYFTYNFDQLLFDWWKDGDIHEVHEMFKRRWGIASIFQREAILIAYAKEVLS